MPVDRLIFGIRAGLALQLEQNTRWIAVYGWWKRRRARWVRNKSAVR